MARPSKYSPVILPLVKCAAHFGATREEIAHYLGVSRDCFHRWCATNEELQDALKIGRDASDARVVESLYRQAIAGNPTCIVFWLKNRRPSEWRDVQAIDANVGHYLISDSPMSEADWIAARTTIDGQASEQSSPVLPAPDDSQQE